MYNSENPYERLCLSFSSYPSTEQIEDSCRQLLVWWQKKLPLKNQPSNPLTQLLRAGLDEAPRYLAEARMNLLNKEMRANIDARLHAQLKAKAFDEFNKFLTFAISNGVLDRQSEENLYHHGAELGLEAKDMQDRVEEELTKVGAKRQADPVPVPVTPPAEPASQKSSSGGSPGNPANEFLRMLRLTGLGENEMTDDQRDAFCNMGENLGLSGGEAEDLIDAYFEEVSGNDFVPQKPASSVSQKPVTPAVHASEVKRSTGRNLALEFMQRITPLSKVQEHTRYPDFVTDLGMEMKLVPSGFFQMGGADADAQPNEKPVIKTMIDCFYLSRFPVTNEQYEKFDPSHRAKRPPWADGKHPVIYVSSLEAIKFCAWLSGKGKRVFRLPTEAEWEYAARGPEGRIYPWGEKLTRGDLANFADCNTTFPWRDESINDGYAQTSPIGTYPKGASPFGIEDMAGNVWEWCIDFFENYKGTERLNPVGPSTGTRRIYRGGSWKSRASSLRSSTRNFNTPDYSSNDVGFRIACSC